MSKQDIANLIATICIHYQTARATYMEADGKIKKVYVEEWFRCIGHKDTREVFAMLDKWLADENKNRYAPDCKYFMTGKTKTAAPVFISDRSNLQWYVDKNGRLFDQDGMEYHDPPYNIPYELKEDHIFLAGYDTGRKGKKYEFYNPVYLQGLEITKQKHKQTEHS